ncbi:MAG TPA: hypothetical protein VJV78_24605 [Polyangiales bacterium]|nr:hypothetical protein [Polyangiales bacterium]
MPASTSRPGFIGAPSAPGMVGVTGAVVVGGGVVAGGLPAGTPGPGLSLFPVAVAPLPAAF